MAAESDEIGDDARHRALRCAECAQQRRSRPPPSLPTATRSPHI
jgi:hypothetical protein